MSDVDQHDILLRCGGRAFERYGTLTYRTAAIRRGGEDIQEVFTRADVVSPVAMTRGRGGIFEQVAANQPRLWVEDLDGDGIEETYWVLEDARTNIAQWTRDLTNAVWTKTNITPAKDQTGIDGTANGASSLLATDDNGTVTDDRTLASSQRVFSAYVKRLVGSGGVDLTLDGGSTWSPVTVTTDWTLVQTPAQTLANPVHGFRLRVNGDKIAVDACQDEGGPFASTPLFNTNGLSRTRAAEDAVLTLGLGVPARGDSYTVLLRFVPKWSYTPAAADATEPGLFTFGGIAAHASDSLVQWSGYRTVGSGVAAGLASHLYSNGNGLAFCSAPASGVISYCARLWAESANHRSAAESSVDQADASTARLVSPYKWRLQTFRPGQKANGAAAGFILLRDCIVARGRFTLAEMLRIP